MNLNICVPYRNMEQDLDKFLHFFKKEKNNKIKLFIIEQNNDGRRFNLGKLINIGYSLTKSDTSIYMFHPVDYIPEAFDQYLNYIQEIPKDGILGLYDSKHQNGEYYYKACMYSNYSLDSCNGYPNTFWGWGGEDDCFFRRMSIKNIPRKNIDIGPCLVRNTETSPDYKIGFDNNHKINQTEYDILNDGISTLSFNIIDTIDIVSNVKRIKVNL